MIRNLKIFLLLSGTFLRMISEGQQTTTDVWSYKSKGFTVKREPPPIQFYIDSSAMKEDTICLPMSVAKKIMTAAEQKKVLEERISLLNEDIRLLGERIDNLKAKDSLSLQIINTYADQVKTMQ